MKIQRIDHVGVVVRDLAAAKAFFIDFGLEVLAEAEVAGEWVDRVVGLEGVKAAIVMLGRPMVRRILSSARSFLPRMTGLLSCLPPIPRVSGILLLSSTISKLLSPR